MTVGNEIGGLGLINLAKGKKAWLSAASKWSHPNDAWRAMDDDGQRDFSFHTGQEDNPWWLIDLEQVYSLFFIVIGNRRKMHQEMAGTLTIEVSNDLLAWEMVHTGRIFWDGELTFPLMGQVSARYVKLSLRAAKTYLHLAKVEIWGSADPIFNPPFPGEARVLIPMPQEADARGQLVYDCEDCGRDGDKSDSVWLVDLQDIYPVETIVVDRPDELEALKSGAMKIETSRDSRQWQTIHEGRLHWRGRLNYPLQGEVIARFVRFSAAEAALGLARVRVLASKADDLVVVHLRKDGLGSRLASLLNALYLAKILNCEMKFIWPGLNYGDLNDGVLGHNFGSALEFFSREFCDRHLLPAAAPTHEAKLTLQTNLYRRHLLRRALHETKGQLRSTFKNAAKILNPNLTPDDALRPGQFFREIGFGRDIEIAINLADQAAIPDKCAALHIRSGDIVYQEIREDGFVWLNKAMPIQLAKMVIEKLRVERRGVILFGEDTKVLRHLAALYGPPVSLAADYLPQEELSEAQRSMFDLVLLSRVDTVYCGISSYFSQCAQVINGGSKIMNIHSLFTVEDMLSYFTEDMRLYAGQYPALQNAFSYGYLYHIAHRLNPDSRRLADFLDSGAACDLEGQKYKILGAIECFKKGRDQDGDVILKETLNISVAENRLIYDKPRCLTFIFGFDDFRKKHLEPLEAAAARGNSGACAAMAIICAAHGQKDQAGEWKAKAIKHLTD